MMESLRAGPSVESGEYRVGPSGCGKRMKGSVEKGVGGGVMGTVGVREGRTF